MQRFLDQQKGFKSDLGLLHMDDDDDDEDYDDEESDEELEEIEGDENMEWDFCGEDEDTASLN